MAKAVKVVAEVRSTAGSSQGRRLRRGGQFPGVVYGVGKQPQNVQLDEKAFHKALSAHASEHLLMDLEITGGETKKVLLQEVQHHPISGRVIHADFHEVSMTQKLRVKIPVRLVNEPVGVVTDGGVLEYLVREVEVECLPGDIVEGFDVDVSAMKIGDTLLAGGVAMDKAKYTLITNPDLALVAVSAPREEEVVAAPDAAAATAEPEVIKEKKEEGEEGAAAEAGGKDAKPAAGAKDAKPAAGKDAKPAAGGKEAKPAAKEAKK